MDHRRLATAAMTVRSAVTAGALALAVGVGSLGAASQDVVPSPSADIELVGEAGELFERHRCSATGFEQTAMPIEAVVRFWDGRTEIVSFDRGWESYTGEAAGEMIAVCLGATE